MYIDGYNLRTIVHVIKVYKFVFSSIHYQKQYSSSLTSPSNSLVKSGSSSKLQSLKRRPSSSLISPNINWENGSSAGSPISPLSSSSSSSMNSTNSWPLSTVIPEPTITDSTTIKKKPCKHNNEQPSETLKVEQPAALVSDIETICASFNTVADLVQAHRRRVLAEHDSRELEARPDLLLVPIDQLAFVYERERTKESDLLLESKKSSLTTVEKLSQSSDLIALPFIDCPFEFDLVLDELVVQNPKLDL